MFWMDSLSKNLEAMWPNKITWPLSGASPHLSTLSCPSGRGLLAVGPFLPLTPLAIHLISTLVVEKKALGHCGGCNLFFPNRRWETHGKKWLKGFWGSLVAPGLYIVKGVGLVGPYESNSQWARSAAPIAENPDVRHFVCERFENLWSWFVTVGVTTQTTCSTRSWWFQACHKKLIWIDTTSSCHPISS